MIGLKVGTILTIGNLRFIVKTTDKKGGSYIEPTGLVKAKRKAKKESKGKSNG